MDTATFKYDLNNLRKLHTDLEKQMIQFDEIIPFERQTTAKIFSPRLLNMMITCGPQIEAVTELICLSCNIEVPKKKNIPKLIQKINSKAVLSNFEITSRSHYLLFTPFTRDLEWWQTYNDLKHELAQKQSTITYTVVMDALAALAALHRLADVIKGLGESESIQYLLQREYWNPTFNHKGRFGGKTGPDFLPGPWKSLIFKISNYFVYAGGY